MPTTHQYSGPTHLAFPKMPGRYGVKSGYVYALICERRTVKIGSAVHPRFRIGEQCRGGCISDGNHYGQEKRVRVRRIILSGTHRRCRELERSLHLILKPFRLGHHLNERYRLTGRVMGELMRLFDSPLSTRRLQDFTHVIYAREVAAK